MLLRGMNPQILAVDEITHPNDITALLEAAGCGAGLLATAHGESLSDLKRRPVYRAMLQEGIFQRAVLLFREGGQRATRVEELS